MDAVYTQTLLEEVADFLTSQPSLEEIVSVHPSDPVQARVRYLLEQNRNGTLTAEENAELDQIEQVNHLMMVIKAKAREKLQ